MRSWNWPTCASHRSKLRCLKPHEEASELRIQSQIKNKITNHKCTKNCHNLCKSHAQNGKLKLTYLYKPSVQSQVPHEEASELRIQSQITSTDGWKSQDTERRWGSFTTTEDQQQWEEKHHKHLPQTAFANSDAECIDRATTPTLKQRRVERCCNRSLLMKGGGKSQRRWLHSCSVLKLSSEKCSVHQIAKTTQDRNLYDKIVVPVLGLAGCHFQTWKIVRLNLRWQARHGDQPWYPHVLWPLRWTNDEREGPLLTLLGQVFSDTKKWWITTVIHKELNSCNIEADLTNHRKKISWK